MEDVASCTPAAGGAGLGQMPSDARGQRPNWLISVFTQKARPVQDTWRVSALIDGVGCLAKFIVAEAMRQTNRIKL